MIIRILKLKLTKKQEAIFDGWLWNLTGVYNWAIRKIELDAQNKIFESEIDYQSHISGHSKRMGIPSHVMRGTVVQAYRAWQRCFQKKAKKPHFKGKRNKLNSILFPDPVSIICDNKILIRGHRTFGKLRYHKQDLPEGKIKCSRLIKKASGWHLYLFIDAIHRFPVKQTEKSVGIDPGFKTLLTLSDGIKFENPRELRNGELRLAQAQRARDHKLVGKLHEKQSNRRNDRNHKISRKLVENYKTIYYSNDSFKGMAKLFGKSVSEASLGQLIAMTKYKSSNCGREIIAVKSSYTTMTCSSCWARTGPKGLAGLTVRFWECSACGADHDRDINAAKVVLRTGAGTALKIVGDSDNRQKSFLARMPSNEVKNVFQ